MRNFARKWWGRVVAAWRVLRDGALEEQPLPSIAATPTLAEAIAIVTAPPVHTAPCVVPVGRHRVTRERPLGTIIETLYQGSGAAAGQAYERYNTEVAGEYICYYRRNERCGAKTQGEL